MSFQESSHSLRSRLHLGDINPAVLIGVIVLVIVVIVCVGFAVITIFGAHDFSVAKAEDDLQTYDEVQNETQSSDESQTASSQNREAAQESVVESSQQAAQICVHVGGCVAFPGVYYLDANSRVIDAVEAAGGFGENAASDAINLARVLSDGEQIIVLTNEEVEQTPAVTTTESATGTDTSAGTDTSVGAGASTGAQASSKININTADSSQLQTLNGIGEATAAKIIAYREENGAFAAIEDIKLVSGIGDKKFENIKDEICVN